MKADNTQYPVVENRVVSVMNDYGNLADGKAYELDYTDIDNGNLADEAIRFICDRYRTQRASVTYLRVLYPAVKRFDEYAKQHDIHSFREYTDQVRADYRDYLDGLEQDGAPMYSEKYKRYLATVPRTICNYL